jgi:two-component system alkaline phosphatase synthesis response regulator PhoP
MRKVLFVSENTHQLGFPVNNTEQQFNFFHCDRFSSAVSTIKNLQPDAIVIDSDRQELAALELCFLIKSKSGFNHLKTIILSSSTEAESEIASFKAGADDFVTKPLRQAAFLTRLSRRIGIGGETIALQSATTFKKLHIDKDAYTVHLNQEIVPLSKKEFELLHLLASHPFKVFTRDEIFDKVWKREGSEKDRTIDVHILRIRKKIGEDIIQTQKGIGYRLVI